MWSMPAMQTCKSLSHWRRKVMFSSLLWEDELSTSLGLL